MNEGNVTNSVNEMERQMTGTKNAGGHVGTAKHETPGGIKAEETTMDRDGRV